MPGFYAFLIKKVLDLVDVSDPPSAAAATTSAVDRAPVHRGSSGAASDRAPATFSKAELRPALRSRHPTR